MRANLRLNICDIYRYYSEEMSLNCHKWFTYVSILDFIVFNLKNYATITACVLNLVGIVSVFHFLYAHMKFPEKLKKWNEQFIWSFVKEMENNSYGKNTQARVRIRVLFQFVAIFISSFYFTLFDCYSVGMTYASFFSPSLFHTCGPVRYLCGGCIELWHTATQIIL